MTIRRDLKRLIRARQARTGESYVAARRHVLAERPRRPLPPVELIELLDVSDDAARLGLACRVTIIPELAARAAPAVILQRLREIVLATLEDPAMACFRAVVLAGLPPPFPALSLTQIFDEGRRFRDRIKAGLGGLSDSGRFLAFHLDTADGSVLVMCLLWPMISIPGYVPRLIVSSSDGPLSFPEIQIVR